MSHMNFQTIMRQTMTFKFYKKINLSQIIKCGNIGTELITKHAQPHKFF